VLALSLLVAPAGSKLELDGIPKVRLAMCLNLKKAKIGQLRAPLFPAAMFIVFIFIAHCVHSEIQACSNGASVKI
jgi:hypothetical protein